MANEYYYGQVTDKTKILVEWFDSDNLKVGAFGVHPVDGTRESDFINGKYTIYKTSKRVTVFQVVQRVHPDYVITWEDLYRTKRAAYNEIVKQGYELPEMIFDGEQE